MVCVLMEGWFDVIGKTNVLSCTPDLKIIRCFRLRRTLSINLLLHMWIAISLLYYFLGYVVIPSRQTLLFHSMLLCYPLIFCKRRMYLSIKITWSFKWIAQKPQYFGLRLTIKADRCNFYSLKRKKNHWTYNWNSHCKFS